MATRREQRTRHGYSSFQIALHWIVVALVVLNWFLGQAMEEIFDDIQDGEGVPSLWPAYLHVAVGVTILLAMAVRLAARIRRPVATAPDSPGLLATLGRINHWLFYGLLLVIPPIGAYAWFVGSEDAGELHATLVGVLVALVLLHAGAALFHTFVLRDGLLGRMLRPEA